MSCYIINYDLNNSKDYDSVFKAIKSYDKWAKVLKSCWAVVTTKTAVEVRDHLASVMDNDDGLFVVKSSGIGAWQHVECSNQWLKDNL
ncbi:hypothetical protein SAMN05421786_104140 [Chryseobacterium ureilyticum]|uniref:CRISPR associated protein Cas2 n=1 Tax=Chryseobacterium ureilyticum TaxID=373668 RepID=A0A1N7NWR5_9FLAO|nr:hypothetical protein [Chryseobacterium ureilyticum]SIT02803.1 hypothetical protein SAMN05421786_104140 [Chryseobacterium ureilyticum]